EFYAKMSVIHLKKKDVVKSKVRGVEMEFDHEKLATILGIPGNNGICEYVKDVWEESKGEEEEERNRGDFDWEAMIDEATAEGESSSERSFMMPRIRIKALRKCKKRFQRRTPQSSTFSRRNRSLRESTLVSYRVIPEVVMTKLQAEFERKRANRFLADLEKAKAENTRLLALLHQAQSKPHP
ncbi:hypothetical protein Dimus_036880, partial [Dionaea muscipula]